MNILLCIAFTTGILSGLWGWVAVSLGLLSWAGFLGCTAYFACPQGGVKGFSSLVVPDERCYLGTRDYEGQRAGSASGDSGLYHDRRSRVFDVYPGKAYAAVVCTGTFMGACATFAGQGDWALVLPSLMLGLVFGYAMKNSGLWLAARRDKAQNITAVSE